MSEGGMEERRRRPQRRPKDEELEARLQNALIVEAQKDALREREKRVAAERDKKIEKRLLPAQTAQCISDLAQWDSDANIVVPRMPTAKELADHTQSYEGLVLTDAKPRRQGLIVSAIRSGSVALVNAVIKELGACRGVFDATNFNCPLHFAAVVSGSSDIVRALMDAGHKPTQQNRFGWTPLDFSRLTGNDIVSELLQKKPDADRFAADVGMEAAAVDEEERDNLLALTAVRSRQVDLIKFIAPRVPNAGRALDPASGNTALHFAVMLMDNPFVVLMLLQANADLEHRNDQGRTAMNLAQVKNRDKSGVVITRWKAGDRAERLKLAEEFGEEAVGLMMSAQMDSMAGEGEEEEGGGEGGQEGDEAGSRLGTADTADKEEEARQRRVEERGARSKHDRFDIRGELEEALDDDPDREATADPTAVDPQTPGGGLLGEVGAGLLETALREIQMLRQKVEDMESAFASIKETQGDEGGDAAADEAAAGEGGEHGTAGDQPAQAAGEVKRRATPPSRPRSRPTTADAMGAGAMEEVFHKLQLLQRRIDEHELHTETHSQSLTRQQENALYQINAKMAQISTQQRQTTDMIAETNSRLETTLHFDAAGQPNMPGKMVVRVQAAHGLLHLEKSKAPSPYFVLSLQDQVHVSAVSPETRNPLWDKEMLVDVPSTPSKLVVSVLDRTVAGADKVVVLGRAEISLNVPPQEDVDDWHDLSTDDFGLVKQHAGSVRVRRRFVPLSEWSEYLRTRPTIQEEENAAGEVTEVQEGEGEEDETLDTTGASEGQKHFGGLYLMLLRGDGLAPAESKVAEGVQCQIVFDQGENHFESPWRPLGEKMMWGTRDEEFYCGEVDPRLRLKIYLCYESKGNIDRAAYSVLNLTTFPYMQMYEDWHVMDVNAGMGNIQPRLRLGLFRGPKPDPHDIITCTLCGLEVPRQFQAPHLSVSCPKYYVPCPHERVGCTWKGPRQAHDAHLEGCAFEELRESIYATASDIRGVQALLIDGSRADASTNAKAGEMSYIHAAVPTFLRVLRGHKRPVTSVTGIKTSGQLISSDSQGYVMSWILEDERELDSYRAHQGEVSCLLWSESFSSYIFTGGAYPDDTIKVWDSSDFSLERKMLGGGQNFAINSLASMRYGSIDADELDYLYSVDDSASIRSWDVQTGACIASASGHELGIKTIVASDGRLVTGSLDMSVRIWDPATLECLATLDCLGDSVMDIIFIGKWLLAAGTHSVRIWDFPSRQLYRVLDGSRWPLCFADGMLFCSQYDVPQNIQVWTAIEEDPSKWKVVDVLKGHSSEVTCMAWFQQTLATGSTDKTVRLWRAPSKDSLVG